MRYLRACELLVLALLLGACAGTQESSNELPVSCVDKPDRGTCSGQLKRFWYDYQTNQCRMFYYGGCGGHVPFETREECEDRCVVNQE